MRRAIVLERDAAGVCSKDRDDIRDFFHFPRGLSNTGEVLLNYDLEERWIPTLKELFGGDHLWSRHFASPERLC